MAIYVEKFGGYIADNPNIEFRTCKGVQYSYDEVNTASMTNNSETLEITGGQGNFPLAILDTTKTLEFTFESSEFTLDMFAMANDLDPEVAGDYDNGQGYYIMTSKLFDVDGNTIVITDDCNPDSIYVHGFTKGEAPASGVYTVNPTDGTSASELETAKEDVATKRQTYDEAVIAYNAKVAAAEDASTEKTAMDNAKEAWIAARVAYEVALSSAYEKGLQLTFAAGDLDADKPVRVGYERRVKDDSNVVSVLTTSHTVTGELTATWPVYSSGTDCDEASVKAYVHVYVPRVRATALPGFDSSYKSAMTQSITFTALDPKRPDKKMFDVIWEDGE